MELLEFSQVSSEFQEHLAKVYLAKIEHQK
jgi:hypothetical protein